MELRANFKNKEIGVIPTDWEVEELGDVITLKNGYAFSSKYFSQDGPIVITPGNFKLTGGLEFNSKNTLHYAGNITNDMIFNNGDLLIVMTDLTPSCELLGKPGIVDTNEVILHNQRICKITITSKRLDKDYLYRYFTSDFFSKWMKDTATGSTVRHTSVGSIKKSIIPLPPLPEQRRIAEVLSDMDGLIGSLEKLLAKKRLIRQGMMQRLLTPQEDWEVKRLGEILSICHGKDQKSIESRDGKYPILGTGGVLGYTNSYLFDAPSVLIGRKGTIDKPIYMDVPFWTVDTLFYSEIFQDNDPKFVFYLFSSINWRSYNEASGVPSLNAGTIENISVSVPNYNKQKEIAGIMTDFDNEVSTLSEKIKKHQNIKQGMMQKLLTGEIRLM